MEESQAVDNTPAVDERAARKQRVRELLLIIGGLEEAIRLAIEEEDWDIFSILKNNKKEYYAELRMVIYGFPPH